MKFNLGRTLRKFGAVGLLALTSGSAFAENLSKSVFQTPAKQDTTKKVAKSNTNAQVVLKKDTTYKPTGRVTSVKTVTKAAVETNTGVDLNNVHVPGKLSKDKTPTPSHFNVAASQTLPNVGAGNPNSKGAHKVGKGHKVVHLTDAQKKAAAIRREEKKKRIAEAKAARIKQDSIHNATNVTFGDLKGMKSALNKEQKVDDQQNKQIKDLNKKTDLTNTKVDSLTASLDKTNATLDSTNSVVNKLLGGYNSINVRAKASAEATTTVETTPVQPVIIDNSSHEHVLFSGGIWQGNASDLDKGVFAQVEVRSSDNPVVRVRAGVKRNFSNKLKILQDREEKCGCSLDDMFKGTDRVNEAYLDVMFGHDFRLGQNQNHFVLGAVVGGGSDFFYQNTSMISNNYGNKKGDITSSLYKPNKFVPHVFGEIDVKYYFKGADKGQDHNGLYIEAKAGVMKRYYSGDRMDKYLAANMTRPDSDPKPANALDHYNANAVSTYGAISVGWNFGGGGHKAKKAVHTASGIQYVQ